MSSLIQEATIKIRQDTANNWSSENPTPLRGEWCYETDTEKIKIGDGSTAWNTLDYIVGDNTITLAKMAGGIAGNLITYDDSGDPEHVAVGTSGQVLTSNGAGNAPSMEDPTMPKQYTEADSDFSITVTGATLDSVQRFVCVPYQTTDGAWRMIGNGEIALTGNDGTFNLRILGIVIKTGTNQVAIGFSDWGNITEAMANPGNNYFDMISNVAALGWRISFDVELNSKPTWAD